MSADTWQETTDGIASMCNQTVAKNSTSSVPLISSGTGSATATSRICRELAMTGGSTYIHRFVRLDVPH